jgi:quinol monooxygenase YgiN
MVLYTMKWNVLPDKTGEYMAWTKGAIQRTVGAGGVIEFRAYRPASGPFQVVITLEFADMAAWATWYSTEVVQTVFAKCVR